MEFFIFICVTSWFIGLTNLVASEDIKDLNFKQLVKLAQDTSHLKIEAVRDDDIMFLISTRSSEQAKLITNVTEIDVNRPVKIIIHGWLANYRRSWYKDITEEFLKNGDYNVIQVDWEKPARASYVSSAFNTKLVGERIAKFITDAKIPPKNIHMVGHSLGAHIAGFAGKQIYQITDTKVSRISGLDPASPYFQEYIFSKDDRLDSEDADIVDVIHTDPGVYGVAFPLGTLDIYVNKGTQPGCSYATSINSVGELVENSFCNHAMSITYFIEWINSGKFHCKICSSWTFYLINMCLRTADLREDEITTATRGICDTRTKKVKPFLYQ